VNALGDGTWKGEAYLGIVSNQEYGAGIMDFAPYDYEQVPQITAATSLRSRLRFIETKYDAFEGAIKDQDGNIVLPKGEQFDDDYIYNEMDWFFEGVVGEAPGDPPPPVSD
jgi:hypothetical protein